MNISIMNISYQKYPFDYFLDSVERLGVQAIELWAGEPHLYVDSADSRKVGAMARDIRARGLKTVCFSPEQFVYPINIAAKDEEYRRRSIEYLKKSVHMTVDFECPIMLITPGHGYYNEPKKEAWKRAVDSLHTLSKEAESAGIALVMETFSKFGSNLVNHIADLQNIIAEVQSPALRPMLDTAPMYLAGEGVDEYFAAFDGKIEHVHLVDGDGQSAAHLAYGDGVYPIDSYIRSLRNYTGYITPELIIPKYLIEPEKSIKKCLEFLRNA